jgi:transcriptional regulator with XRE-family HTH domain
VTLVAASCVVRIAPAPFECEGDDPTVIIDADRLRYEMALRGMTAGELARMACVNKNTITRALSGRSVSRRTLRELTRALLAHPHLRMADVLLAKPQVA